MSCYLQTELFAQISEIYITAASSIVFTEQRSTEAQTASEPKRKHSKSHGDICH